MAKQGKIYKVLIEISSDATGKSFLPGQTITGDDFPSEVIENWLQIGVLELASHKEEESDGESGQE